MGVPARRSFRTGYRIRSGSWARTETITGTLTVLQVVETAGDRQQLLVRFAPGGSRGFQARYTFTTSGGRITQVDLQYA